MSPARKPKPRLPEQVTLKRKRFYDLHDGTKLPSVTTVLSVALNKPALPGWAARVVAEEAMVYLPKLVRLSRSAPDEAVKFLKGRPYAQRDDAATAGTAAHAIAEAHVLGQPYETPDPSTDAGKMLAHFVRFLADWRPEFEATEAVVANRTIGYAGTLDALARIPALDNRLLVLDYKTSKSGPYAEWALQIAAYARAEELYLKDGTCVPMPTVDGAAVLRLRPDKYALHVVDADIDQLLATFTHARQLATWALDADGDSPFTTRLDVPEMTTPLEVA